MGKKALNSHANGKGHSKKVQLKSKTFWTVKLNLKPKIQKIIVRFMTRMAIMIETPSSRIEKIQTTIPTNYYDEKQDVCWNKMGFKTSFLRLQGLC